MALSVSPPALPWHGGCQCGLVRYRVTVLPLTLYACHCRECQRQSGSAHGLSMRVPAEGVSLTGEHGLARRADPDAPPVRGVFCLACGTRLLHVRAGRPTLNVKPGTLDDPSWIVPVAHLWTRSAQAGFLPPAGALKFDGQPESDEPLIAAWRAACGLPTPAP